MINGDSSVGRYVIQLRTRGSSQPHTLLATSMFPLVRATVRAFHSPFVALGASSRLTIPPTVAPVYEKQDDSSSEPHLSSSGTRTYVVSEPDPSDTPYQVPSGAYPNSASYVDRGPTPNPEALHSATGSSIIHPHNAHTVGESAAVRNTEVSGEMGPRGGNHGSIDFMDATNAKPGKF